MARSLGRPVRLSSVELRLLPRPGFVLTDLTVEEDPAFGAEPVLHANTVTASIRLLSLWRGRLEIERDQRGRGQPESGAHARTAAGTWIRCSGRPQPGAPGAGRTPARRHAPRFLTLRRPIPASISRTARRSCRSRWSNTDLSFWQEQPGEWRIRLRGQPARTDVSLDLADTGVVELEASARPASELRQMPVRLDLEWRDAQLGQLSRLAIGSDPAGAAT